MPTRHLHFVQSTEPLEGGGLGRAAMELSDALRAGGACSRLVTTGLNDDFNEDATVYRRFGPTRAFFAPGLRRTVSQLVAGADLVHGHGFYVASNWILGGEARRRRKPLVYHPHGMFEPWIVARSRWKKQLAHLLFETANFQYASLWRALTTKEADQIRVQGVKGPIVVCANGIDLKAFDSIPQLRDQARSGKQRRELLFLARLHPKKGLAILVAAWGRLPKVLRESWRVVIAGPDELGHRAEVEGLIKGAELEADFEFVGSLGGVAKLAALARADAFVLPSHSEGFSVAILEAMACGLPVLATNACNFPALAEDGGGWCVPDQVDELAVALQELLCCDESALRERGALARMLVERDYTWARIAARLDEACGSILSR